MARIVGTNSQVLVRLRPVAPRIMNNTPFQKKESRVLLPSEGTAQRELLETLQRLDSLTNSLALPLLVGTLCIGVCYKYQANMHAIMTVTIFLALINAAFRFYGVYLRRKIVLKLED